jgi:alpha-beta hydrolase superfamily lysophospholipase
VRLRIPPAPAGGRRPAVIGALPDPDAAVAAGIVVATYRVNWHLLAGLRGPNPKPPPPNVVGVWLLASPSPRTIGQAYLGLIAHDATHVIPRIVDHLEAQPEVDPARIAVAGISTSGFMALQAVAAEPRLAAAAAVVACGDYHAFLHLSNLAMNGQPLDLDPDYARWLRANEPVAHPARLVHAAVLMVNGADDPAVPAACSIETARTLARAYARAGAPERFRFVLVPGAGHNLGGRAPYEVLAWWYRWLLRP